MVDIKHFIVHFVCPKNGSCFSTKIELYRILPELPRHSNFSSLKIKVFELNLTLNLGNVNYRIRRNKLSLSLIFERLQILQ